MIGGHTMRRNAFFCTLPILLVACQAHRLRGQSKDELADFRAAGLRGGNPARGKAVFESDGTRDARNAMPSSRTIGSRGRGSAASATSTGASNWSSRCWSRVPRSTPITARSSPRRRTAKSTRACSASGPTRNSNCSTRRANSCGCRSPRSSEEQRTGTSLMPAGLQKTLKPEQFADLIAYLETLEATGRRVAVRGHAGRDPVGREADPARADDQDGMRFDHPVWIIAVPGSQGAFLVVEQKTRKIWRFEEATVAPEGAVRRPQRRGDDRRIRGRRVRRVPSAIRREPQVLRELPRPQSGQLLLAGDRRAAGDARPEARRGRSVPAVVADPPGYRPALGRHAGVRPRRIPVYRRGRRRPAGGPRRPRPGPEAA